MKKDDTPQSVAEMRSLAEEAEAEAAEAEALAAAARARARAIRLRREAEIVASTEVGSGTNGLKVDDATIEPAEPPVTLAKPDAAKIKLAKGPVKKAGGAKATAAAEQPEPVKPARIEERDTEVADDRTTETLSDETDADAADDENAEEPAARSARRGLRRPTLKSVAAVLAVAITLFAVGASVEMSVLHRNATRERQQVAEFAAGARQGVVTLTSLDYEHAKEGVQHILEVSTGTFKDDFLKMAEDFTKVVEESKVISQGSVQAAAVELDTMTENSAVVLVASTSEVTNAAGAKQDPRKYRLIVTMTREGGRLKMSKVEFVP